MEAIPSAESSIILVVKTPNQRVRDIEVNCLLNWTVAKLKSHLTNVYPTKPTRSSQKIIYSGKLLDDNFVLKDILLNKSEGQQQAVHLVCTPSATDINQDTSKNNSQSPDQTKVQPEVSSSTASTTFSATQPDGLRHRHVHHAYPQHPYYHMFPSHFHTYAAQNQHGQANGESSGSGQSHIPPNAHHFGHYAAHHMAHMQWMHHMSQMMHTMPYGQMMQPPFPYQQQVVNDDISTTPSSPPAAPVAAQEDQPAQPPAAQGRRENQERNVVMNANAGGGIMQDDEDEQENLQRDWLDHVYMAVRILMLMSIFWFYASPGRLFGMAVVMCILWLLQSGWLNLNRAQRNRHPAENVAGEARPEHQEDEDEEIDDENETDSQFSESDETDANTTSRSNDPRPEHPGYFVVCYNFVTTFFTSLVPQGPQHIGQP